MSTSLSPYFGGLDVTVKIRQRPELMFSVEPAGTLRTAGLVVG